MIVVSGSAPGVSLGAVRDRATKATIREEASKHPLRTFRAGSLLQHPG
ncbi:MAG TPA: hypothetical protein P5544_01840 [Candidatus Nanopelagicales bacterium]|nr:hypothetical protein [Candidatus Nanopelagicales bacterium]